MFLAAEAACSDRSDQNYISIIEYESLQFQVACLFHDLYN